MTGAPASVRGLRVAVLNWRDTGDPEAGGAEVYTEQVARGLAAGGAHVTYVTSRAAGEPRTEVREGVHYVRRGRRWSSYLYTPAWLLTHRRRLDAVVDCQNGLAYAAPLFVPASVRCILLVHHVHQDQWAVHFPAPVAAVGRWVERVTAGKVYRARPLVAVSRSTAGEVRSRLGHNGPTRVAYNGSPPSTELPRPDPTRRPRRVACVGRLARHKRVADLVQAVPDLPPDVVVDVVGTGDLLGPLRSQVERMRLGDRVVVHGFLPSGAVADVLDRAVLHVQPSAGEGWGLTILEAAARGVPSVVHPVPGLRESVVDGVTGWHVLPTETLAQALVRALADLEQPGRAEAMAAGCRAYATRFAWEDTVTAFTDLLGSPAPAG